VLSLGRHSPRAHVRVTAPTSDRAFRDWVARQPNASMYDTELQPSGWDVKPSLLLRHLAAGGHEVTWLDADVIATGDLQARLDREPCASLVATEDVWWGREQGSFSRTLAWGLAPGRALPTTVNSALLRVGAHHVELLQEWQEMLSSPAYRAAQHAPWDDRPLHLWGDQEVLTALLSSERHASVQLSLLRRGIDIAQCYGPGSFSPGERLELRRSHTMPTLVHAMGRKPWEGTSPSGRDTITDRAHQRLSPYSWAAAGYEQDLGERAPWLHTNDAISRLCRWASGDDPLLREMPLALTDAASRWARRLAGRVRHLPRKATSKGGTG
jgi:hypothetical protein